MIAVIPAAHGANTPDKHLTIGLIAVTDEIAWSLVPPTGLSELLGDPFRGWMRRGPQVRGHGNHIADAPSCDEANHENNEKIFA